MVPGMGPVRVGCCALRLRTGSLSHFAFPLSFCCFHGIFFKLAILFFLQVFVFLKLPHNTSSCTISREQSARATNTEVGFL